MYDQLFEYIFFLYSTEWKKQRAIKKFKRRLEQIQSTIRQESHIDSNIRQNMKIVKLLENAVHVVNREISQDKKKSKLTQSNGNQNFFDDSKQKHTDETTYEKQEPQKTSIRQHFQYTQNQLHRNPLKKLIQTGMKVYLRRNHHNVKAESKTLHQHIHFNRNKQQSKHFVRQHLKSDERLLKHYKEKHFRSVESHLQTSHINHLHKIIHHITNLNRLHLQNTHRHLSHLFENKDIKVRHLQNRMKRLHKEHFNKVQNYAKHLHTKHFFREEKELTNMHQRHFNKLKRHLEIVQKHDFHKVQDDLVHLHRQQFKRMEGNLNYNHRKHFYKIRHNLNDLHRQYLHKKLRQHKLQKNILRATQPHLLKQHLKNNQGQVAHLHKQHLEHLKHDLLHLHRHHLNKVRDKLSRLRHFHNVKTKSENIRSHILTKVKSKLVHNHRKHFENLIQTHISHFNRQKKVKGHSHTLNTHGRYFDNAQNPMRQIKGKHIFKTLHHSLRLNRRNNIESVHLTKEHLNKMQGHTSKISVRQEYKTKFQQGIKSLNYYYHCLQSLGIRLIGHGILFNNFCKYLERSLCLRKKIFF